MLPVVLVYPAVIVLFVTVFVMYGLRRLKRLKKAAGTTVSVAVDAVTFTVFENGKAHNSAGWADIKTVAVITTDKGPWRDTAFYHLRLHDGESLTLPSQAGGMDAFVDGLRKLPRFDTATFDRAQKSGRKDTFAVIVRDEEPVV